ncbi:ribonucleotide-diphosphate reductase subunit alpha [Candidatus Woesebacteria bacterium]|nr:ribonucleotide-diphosphate reductase subunit alpha [Candidatus Woesebacteria bacterium]
METALLTRNIKTVKPNGYIKNGYLPIGQSFVHDGEVDAVRPKINEELLAKRYMQGDEKTWENVVMRVATHAGKKTKRVQEFYEAIYAGKFFPSRMAYMGTPYPFASSCFVFPVEDNLHGIMQTLSDACQVQKYGGGTGYNFSHLRPKGDMISTSGGDSSGPVSFMGLYHNAMEVVHRAGKKHAAQMGILNCDHPNILEFIQCKDKEGAFWTFNISVAVTDKFMEAVKKDENWDLQFGGKVYKTMKARDLWGYIIQHAWHNGDPGIIFIDTVNKYNRYPEPVEACNPCGEQMLPPYVSCNLGSMDLSRLVVDGKVDWKGLEETTRTGIRFLDGSVEAAYWPVAKIRERTRKFHNIGLGVMGWADMLISIGIPYDSDEAVNLGEKVMKFIDTTADDESKKLGGGKRKNVTVTSIAPTGSISLLAGCSSGIEPVFGIVTMKNTYVGSFHNIHWIFEQIAKKKGFYSQKLLEKIYKEGSIQNLDDVPDDVKKLFKTAMEVDWKWHVKHQAAFQKYTDNAVSKTINLPNEATIGDVENAYLMAYETGCKSITVYRDGSRQVQVMDAKKKERAECPNCNAILFMKDGKQVCVTCGYEPSENSLSANENLNPTVEVNNEMESGASVSNGELHKGESNLLLQRPTKVDGATYKIETPVGNAFITVNHDSDGNPFEIFVTIGKAGSEVAAMAEALGRLISTTLRFGNHLPAKERAQAIMDQLQGIGGARSIGFGPNRVRSLPDAISRAIGMHFGLIGYQPEQSTVPEQLTINGQAVTSLHKDICPSCGEASLVFEEGCKKCYSCGYSEC